VYVYSTLFCCEITHHNHQLLLLPELTAIFFQRVLFLIVAFVSSLQCKYFLSLWHTLRFIFRKLAKTNTERISHNIFFFFG